MNQIKWCFNQKKGIRLIIPNENLSEDYIRKSDNALDVMATVKPDEWKITAAYYACYNALYSLLQKVGIKCEIHDCTIALMSFFAFDKKEMEFIKELKQKRVDAQYYTKAVSLPEEKEVKRFVLRCKEILQKDDFDDMRENVVRKLYDKEKLKKEFEEISKEGRKRVKELGIKEGDVPDMVHRFREKKRKAK